MSPLKLPVSFGRGTNDEWISGCLEVWQCVTRVVTIWAIPIETFVESFSAIGIDKQGRLFPESNDMMPHVIC